MHSVHDVSLQSSVKSNERPLPGIMLKTCQRSETGQSASHAAGGSCVSTQACMKIRFANANHSALENVSSFRSVGQTNTIIPRKVGFRREDIACEPPSRSRTAVAGLLPGESNPARQSTCLAVSHPSDTPDISKQIKSIGDQAQYLDISAACKPSMRHVHFPGGFDTSTPAESRTCVAHISAAGAI